MRIIFLGLSLKDTLHGLIWLGLFVWYLLHCYAEEPIRVWEVIDVGGLLSIQFLLNQRKTFLDSGYLFAPYIPLSETPVVRMGDYESDEDSYEAAGEADWLAAEINAEIDAEILADLRANSGSYKHLKTLTGRWQEEGF